MAGLVPAIHVFASSDSKTWMPGIADKFTQSAQGRLLWPGMTEEADRVNESLTIQLLVAPKNALLVEGNAAVAREIGLDVGPRGDAVVQIDHAGYLALERLHALGECVAQPLDDLKQREIGVSRPAAGEIGAAI